MKSKRSTKQTISKGSPKPARVKKSPSELSSKQPPPGSFIQIKRNAAHNNALLNHLMENIPDAIYFKDLESRFIAVSKALVQKHGLKSADEILGRTDFDFFSEESASKFFESEQSMINTGIPIINEEEMEEWQDGTKTYALGTKMPLKDSRGKTIGTFGISRDITGRKRAEEEIRRINSELRQANEMKDKMISVIAHDLKNPFASILGLSNIIVEDFDELETGEMRNFITTINDSANHLYRLLEQLLTWTTARDGRMKLQMQTVNMYLVSQRVIRILKPLAEAKEITLVSTILADQVVFGDENMIETILRNLAGNAIKYTSNKGLVKIELAEKQLWSTLVVSDNGIGISRNRLETLFQEDKIQSQLGTGNEKGTGFGLLICKEFATQMGGSITVESEPGAGTRCSVTLKRNGGFSASQPTK